MEPKISKSAKRTIGTVIVTLVVIIAIVATWFLSAWFNRGITPSVKTDSVREEIIPVAKLTSYEYNFTQIMQYNDSGHQVPFFGWDIPFTDNMYIATVDGVATIGVNAEKITCDETRDSEGNLTAVDIHLPHSEVQNVTLKHETLTKYEQRDGLLNVVTPDNLNELLVDAEQKQRSAIVENGLLDQSDERVQQLIEQIILTTAGENIAVRFDFINEQPE